MEQYATLAALFLDNCRRHANRQTYYCKNNDGIWNSFSFREIEQIVTKLSFGLSASSVGKGDRVGIISNNRPEWAMADFATICLGGVTVSIYPTLVPNQIKYIIINSEAKVVFVEDKTQAEKIVSFIEDTTFLEMMVVMDNSSIDHPASITWDQLLEKSKQEIKMRSLEVLINAVRSGDLATLIYTSGTTGDPKGVMLTHENIISDLISVHQVTPTDETDVHLSFLPLSHSFERTVGHFGVFGVGGEIHYAENIETVGANIMVVRPTVFMSVPRFYEKMYKKILDCVANKTFIKQKIFWWAINIGKKALRFRMTHQSVPLGLKFRCAVADRLVFTMIREKFGGRLKHCISGAAPLSNKIGEFFGAVGIVILEGYGLTETSPVMTASSIDDFKFGTVGKPIPGMEVKIAEDGEIMNRGSNNMLGYYKDEEATRDTIDEDGWLHTGDIGEFDGDRFLRITDRKKNIIVTSGGKNVAPSPLENSLITSKYVEQSLAIGDERNFISALIVPAFEVLKGYAVKEGIKFDDSEDLVKDERILSLYDGIVNKAMKNFSRYESIRKFELLSNEWTINSGELTPTLKIKRRIIEEKYVDLIDKMYNSTTIKSEGANEKNI